MGLLQMGQVNGMVIAEIVIPVLLKKSINRLDCLVSDRGTMKPSLFIFGSFADDPQGVLALIQQFQLRPCDIVVDDYYTCGCLDVGGFRVIVYVNNEVRERWVTMKYGIPNLEFLGHKKSLPQVGEFVSPVDFKRHHYLPPEFVSCAKP
jgi:hypothetical protein